MFPLDEPCPGATNLPPPDGCGRRSLLLDAATLDGGARAWRQGPFSVGTAAPSAGSGA